MPLLENPRHERFAQEVAKGRNASEAYRLAGYDAVGNARESAASRLLSDVKVAARVEELLRRGAERAEISVEKVLVELAKIGFADIRKAVNWRANVTAMVEDPDTGEQRLAVTNEVAIVGSDDIDDATAAAIAEISQTDKGGLKIKLHDKRAALVDIGKHLGMFVERREIGEPGAFDNMTLEQKRERAIGIAKELGLDTIGITSGSA